MNLKRIDGHTLNMDLLSGDVVIDLGCRNFYFAKQMLSFGSKLICVDAASDVFINAPKEIIKYNKAISTKKEKTFIYNELGESGYVSSVKQCEAKGHEIETITLKEIYTKEYDVLKIDIEGSEYDLLSDPLFVPLPKQITVEFHEHSLKELHDKKINEVLDNLSSWYNLIFTLEHEYPYIDTLFIRKDLV